MTKESYLTGLKVLDLTRLLPGPYATLMLAEMGADVLKVEDVGIGDTARLIAPTIGDTSALYMMINRGKRNISVKLRSQEGQSIIRDLALKSDVLVEGFRPGTMAKMGLDYETLSKENPSLIYCSITGYGQSGPYRDRAGHDLNYQSLTGIVDMTGRRDGPPGIPGTQVADLAGGSMAAVNAILAALVRQQRTGEGEYIDISMSDMMVALQPITMSFIFGGGEPPVRGDTTLQGRYICYNIYETKDGRHMSFGPLEPKFFQKFCDLIGRPDLYQAHFSEARDGEPEYEEFRKIFASKTQAEWVEFLADTDTCCEPILNPTKMAEHPHFKERNLFFTAEFEGNRKMRQVYTSPGLSHANRSLEKASPLGKHTKKVLNELEYDLDKIESLIKDGIIFQAIEENK